MNRSIAAFSAVLRSGGLPAAVPAPATHLQPRPRCHRASTPQVYRDSVLDSSSQTILSTHDIASTTAVEIPSTQQRVISLTAGQVVPIKVEFFDLTEHAIIKLTWSYPGHVDEAVPTTSFYLQ